MHSAHDRTSVLIEAVMADITTEHVTVGSLFERLARRSYGAILLLLSVVCLLPGLSLFAGILMLIPAFQMLMGYRVPHLPAFLAERELESETLKKVCLKFIKGLKVLELYAKPKWTFMTVSPFSNGLGILIMMLSLIAMLPLPFSNFPPALALIAIAIGLLERDGRYICLGVATGTLAIVIGILVLTTAMKMLLT